MSHIKPEVGHSAKADTLVPYVSFHNHAVHQKIESHPERGKVLSSMDVSSPGEIFLISLYYFEGPREERSEVTEEKRK